MRLKEFQTHSMHIAEQHEDYIGSQHCAWIAHAGINQSCNTNNLQYFEAVTTPIFVREVNCKTGTLTFVQKLILETFLT